MTVLIDYTKGFFETTEGDTVGTVTGNATLDLSTGSVFSHTPTANTTFAFTNPAASGTSSSATLKLTGANVTSGFDLSSASYDSVSFSVTSQAAVPTSLAFKSDGTKMFVVDATTDTVYEYSLSTAWDVSSATYGSVSFSVSSQETNPNSLAFGDSGTKMYVGGTRNNDSVYQYSLSTAWDLSSASYASKSLDVSSQSNGPYGLAFKSDGTKLFVLGNLNDTVYQYSLSTAWDLSTASYDSVSFSVTTQDNIPQDISFNSDGTKFFVVGNQNDSVYQYSLNTAWDLSTASYDSVSFSVTTQEGLPLGLAFKSDGTKMFVIGSFQDTVYQYTTGSSALATITYPASVIWSGGTTPTAPANGETDVYSFYTDDGGTTYYGFVSGDALA